MLGAQDLCAGRDLYRATPAVTGVSIFPVSSEGFSTLLRYTRRCGGPILTQILKGLKNFTITYLLRHLARVGRSHSQLNAIDLRPLPLSFTLPMWTGFFSDLYLQAPHLDFFLVLPSFSCPGDSISKPGA
jgi:hypothetical protein